MQRLEVSGAVRPI